MQNLSLSSDAGLKPDRHTLWALVLLRMYSRRGPEHFEVPGVQERSGTLLFVQVGRGVVMGCTRHSGARKDSSRTFVWLGPGPYHQVLQISLVANIWCRCLSEKGSRGSTPCVHAGYE